MLSGITYLMLLFKFTLCRVSILLISVRKERIHLCPDYAIKNNLTPFISMQNHYSLAYREEEREMMPTLKVRNFIARFESLTKIYTCTVLWSRMHPLVTVSSWFTDTTFGGTNQEKQYRRVCPTI